MYLLYLDESGNPDDPSDRHFILGGAAVFERTTFHLSQDLDSLQSRYFPGIEPIEFHTQAIRSGKGFWRNQKEDLRTNLLNDIARIISASNDPGVVLFAVVVEKNEMLYGEEAVKRATEEICRRFDLFLSRRHYEEGDTQRGLLVFDEGRFQSRARLWVSGFRNLGTQWGVLRNLSDIPYFASTKETRLLQVADFVSHVVFQLYERRDNQRFREIYKRFDNNEGRIHGLVHVTNTWVTCNCPACANRRNPDDIGDWL